MGGIFSEGPDGLPSPIMQNLLGQSPEGRKFLEDARNGISNTDTFKAGLQQAGVAPQAAEAQATEQQGINQIAPEIAQMLGAPQVNPQQQAQQQQIQAQEESRQREAQDRASFGKDEEFENVMKALGSVNGLMQNR